MDEKKTLSEVMEYMKTEHRFSASSVYPPTNLVTLKAQFTNTHLQNKDV